MRKDTLPEAMLIGREGAAFDDGDYIYEFKFDGVRCLALLDPAGKTLLINKRQINVTPTYPELRDINKQVKKSCLLDGEAVIFVNNRPDFSAIQRRSLMSDKVKIAIAADLSPVTFVAFDILSLEAADLTQLPLIQRKAILSENTMPGGRLMISEYIEREGKRLFEISEKNALEGIVAKRKASLYFPGRRTKDWIKIKNLQDDDFIICGYIPKEGAAISLILAQYVSSRLTYMDHVALGRFSGDFRLLKEMPKTEASPLKYVPKGNENALWLEHYAVGKVSFMERSPSGKMRQGVFRGIREDKAPGECVFSPTE